MAAIIPVSYTHLYPDGVAVRMKAYAAAGSEARMGGCDMPVMINSGSGNQMCIRDSL